MTRLTQWLRNAFDSHDRDDFERAVAQVELMEERNQQLADSQPTRHEATLREQGPADHREQH